VTPGGPSEPAAVHLADGSTIEAELVVAADGVGSTVRRALFGRSGRRDAGFTAFRAVVERVHGARLEGLVVWGRGARFGIIPVSAGSAAWFAALDEPADLPAAEAHAVVRERLRGWPEPAEALVAATPAGALRADRVAFSLPPPAWHVGRAALLGDAAHAMTPSLGQGAAQAIEDAVALGEAVAAHPGDIPAALAAYARRRRRRAEAVAARSAALDRLAALDHPLLCAARDEMLRLLPAALVRAAQRAMWDLPAEHSRRR
jgi:2-polyprenyl-6-methoxyphenol hydroxylase-like FAD-dependent oxidoreductase